MSHYDALKTHLAPLGYPVWLHWCADITDQYLVVSGPAWDVAQDMPVGGIDAGAASDVRVKAVTGTPEGVEIMLARVRGLLSPNLAPSFVPYAGHAVEVRFLRSEFVDVDRSSTITGTNRHPAFGVDAYRLIVQPA